MSSGRRLVWFRTLAFQANDPGFKSRRPHSHSTSILPHIYLLGGNTTKTTAICGYGKIDRSGAAITLTKCPRCSKDITSEDQFSPGCGMVLDAKVACNWRMKERKQTSSWMS